MEIGKSGFLLARIGSQKMNNLEREELKKRLLQYPGVTAESVEHQLDAYEERQKEKLLFVEQRKCSNALVEAYLDRKGYS
jgi:hypothetical protein